MHYYLADPATPPIQPNCSRDKSYVSIIVSVLPLWAIITTLIVLAILLFHKHIRLTKIYDNCTKQNANYVYHVEIRTGDTSATYNRRKTTITIDMFDDNQTTLARIAIPGHVIFGRKESPVPFLDDDKYFELRATRLWLYRSTKLKKVSTIRLTHTCMEPEARIMVYGVELHLDEPERRKLFFPVMNYITPYGTASKINACFDFDPIGSISAMGGRLDPPLISEYLSSLDYTLLVYLYCALVLYLSTFEIVNNSFKNSGRGTLKGAIIGCLCFAIVTLVGLSMRYIFRRQYSLHIGSGLWAYMYHVVNTAIVITATSFWIYSTVKAYTKVCSNNYSIWILSLCVAAAEGFAFAVLAELISWLLTIWYPVTTEQYVLPDEPATGAPPPPTDQDHAREPSQQRAMEHAAKSRNVSTRQSPQSVGTSPSALLMPTASQATGMPTWQTQAGQQPAGIQTFPMMATHGYSPYQPYSLYSQQPMGFKGAGYPGGSYDTAGHYQPQSPGGSPRTLQLPTLHHIPQPQGQSYHQQVTGTITTPSGRTKQTRKTGSNESTGSTYYQQLMKNKGGVKSISQYGELMKQKKNKR